MTPGIWLIIVVTLGLTFWCLTGPASTRTTNTTKKRRSKK